MPIPLPPVAPTPVLIAPAAPGITDMVLTTSPALGISGLVIIPSPGGEPAQSAPTTPTTTRVTWTPLSPAPTDGVGWTSLGTAPASGVTWTPYQYPSGQSSPFQ